MTIHVIPQVTAPDDSRVITDCPGYSSAKHLAVNLNDSRVLALQSFMTREPIQLALSVEAGAELVRYVYPSLLVTAHSYPTAGRALVALTLLQARALTIRPSPL